MAISQRSLYTLVALTTVRCTCIAAFAVIVAAFVALYPYLTGMGSCEMGECPYVVQSSHGASVGFAAAACVTAVLASSFTAAFVSFVFRGRRISPVAAQPS